MKLTSNGPRNVPNKIDADLTVWAREKVSTLHRSGYSGINIIEKILRDPGIATGGSRHRILWWPRSKRLAKMSRAMHRVSQRGQVCLVVEYGEIVKPNNGQILTKQEFSRYLGISVKIFDKNIKKARNILIPLVNKK